MALSSLPRLLPSSTALSPGTGRNRGLLWAVLALGVLLLAPQAARATVIAGESSAFGVHVDLELPLLPDLSVPGTPAVAGAAPAPFDLSDAFLAVDGSVVDLALLAVSAASDVDGGVGIRFASAAAELESLVVDIPFLFSLELSALRAEARSEGEAGALVSVGSALLGSLTVAIGGDVLVDASLAPAPNTVLLPGVLGTHGIEVVLNEQTRRGDGIRESGIAVSALHVRIDRPWLRGEIVVSHAESRLLAVPAPGAAVLLVGAGLAAAGLRRRRRGARRMGRGGAALPGKA